MLSLWSLAGRQEISRRSCSKKKQGDFTARVFQHGEIKRGRGTEAVTGVVSQKPRTLVSLPFRSRDGHRHGDGCRYRGAQRSEEAAAEPIAATRRSGAERPQVRQAGLTRRRRRRHQGRGGTPRPRPLPPGQGALARKVTRLPLLLPFQ